MARPPLPAVPGGSAGVALALLSAMSFGSSGPLAKALIDAGWTSGAVVTARIGLAALLLLVPAVAVLRGRWHLLRSNARVITAFGLVAMAGCQLFFFNAVTTISVGIALLLEYLGIILVVLWFWVRHGHRPRRWTMLGIVLAVGGLALVLDLTGGSSLDLAGVLWGLAAGTGLATYFVMSAHEGGGLPPLVLAAGGMVVATVALLVAGVVGVMPIRFNTAAVELVGAALPWWLPVVALALVATAIAYAAGIAGVRRLGSKVASFLGLTEVLFSIVFAWLLLGQVLGPIQVAGGVLILAGVVAVRYDELRGAPATGTRADQPAAAPAA